jgi:hypothetical protein
LSITPFQSVKAGDTTINENKNIATPQEYDDGNVIIDGSGITINITGPGRIKVEGDNNFTLTNGTVNLSETNNDGGVIDVVMDDTGGELNVEGGTMNINKYSHVGSDTTVNITGGIVNLNGANGVSYIWAGDAVNIDGGTVNVNSGSENYILLGTDSVSDMEFNIGKNDDGRLNILSENKLSVLSQDATWEDDPCALNPEQEEL